MDGLDPDLLDLQNFQDVDNSTGARRHVPCAPCPRLHVPGPGFFVWFSTVSRL